MDRSLIAALLLTFAAFTVDAENVPSTAQPAEDLEEISEFNRAYWRWRRCVRKYEEVHGPSTDGKPPQLCGAQPQMPKG